MLNLDIKKRDIKEDLESLRKEGVLPAVFYGKREKSTPISVSQKQFVKVWESAGESSVVTLKSGDGAMDTLIHAVDVDPVTGVPRHADFYVFDKSHKLEVSVELNFVGVSPAVKDLGGQLVKVLHELTVEAMPKDLPNEITVDISSLNVFGDQILAKELKLPAGVALVLNPEEVVALVAEPKEEVEEEVTPIDLSSIEVEKKGKIDDGEVADGVSGTPDEKEKGGDDQNKK